MSKVMHFWIIYQQDEPFILRLVLNKKSVRQMDIFFSPDIDAPRLRSFLAEYIEEDENMELTTLEYLQHLCKL